MVRRAHVSEDQTLDLLDRVGALADLVADRGVLRLARGLQDRAVHVEVPAVVAAADAALLDLAVFQGGPAVGAMAVQQADPPPAVAKHHQILAHDPDPHRMLLELGGHGHRVPEAAQVFAAGGAGAHMGEFRILLERPVYGVAVKRLSRPANVV
jgi:hypothetical protein